MKEGKTRSNIKHRKHGNSKRPTSPPEPGRPITSIDCKPDPVLVAVAKMRAEMPAMLENMKMMAELTKAKYDALKANGFTDEQALELSKTIM